MRRPVFGAARLVSARRPGLLADEIALQQFPLRGVAVERPRDGLLAVAIGVHLKHRAKNLFLRVVDIVSAANRERVKENRALLEQIKFRGV